MKALFVLGGIAAVVVLLAVTNPSIEAYQQYLHQSILTESNKSKDDLNKALGTLFGGFASSLLVSQTVRSDYVIASTYDTVLGDQHLRVLGILKNFFVYESPKNEHAS